MLIFNADKFRHFHKVKFFDDLCANAHHSGRSGKLRCRLLLNCVGKAEAAPLLAAQYGAEIQFDTQSQTPYFTYLDEAGQPHEVWFEDARSAQAKFALLPEYGLLGLGYWNFMRPFTAGFSLQNYLFTASGLG